ncbi:MAG: hypothetical protein ACOCXH_01590 [Cyclobacteriaceae bacterium]
MNISVRSNEGFPPGKTSGRITGTVTSVNISRKKLIGTRSGPSEQILRDQLTEVSHNNSSLTLKRFAAKSEPGIFSSGKVPGFVFVAPAVTLFFPYSKKFAKYRPSNTIINAIWL